MRSSTDIKTLVHILAGLDQVCEHCKYMELETGHGNSSMNRGVCKLGFSKKRIGIRPWEGETTLNHGCRKFEARD